MIEKKIATISVAELLPTETLVKSRPIRKTTAKRVKSDTETVIIAVPKKELDTKETEVLKKNTKVPKETEGLKKNPAVPTVSQEELENKPKPAKRTSSKKKKDIMDNTSIHIQFQGKSYTTKDLVKIAKNVWVYDLGKKASDFESLELYVKPEESTAYYIMNKTEKGRFFI